MKIALVQFCASDSPAQNLTRLQTQIQRAAATGHSMVLFPEYSMGYRHTRTPEYFSSIAQSLNGTFLRALQAHAAQNQIWVGVGVMEQTQTLPYNTYAIFDNRGNLAALHRKNKLYDAFGACESAEFQAGTEPFQPITTPIGTIGVLTCYELRFPALAAQQKALGAKVLLLPAGWIAGDNKVLHWDTLLRARAIENQMLVLGINQWADGIFTGHSAAYDNSGNCLGACFDENSMLSITI